MGRGIHRRRRLTGAVLGAAILLVAVGAPVAAHEPHEAANARHGDGQVLAAGQNHPRFMGALSCESFGPLPFETEIGPSWYGIETAHHGPDSGTAGKGDGCYQADGSPGADIHNPAIR